MPTRVEPRAFVNFSVRLDLASNERRRRLEKALGLSAPRLLERLFCNFDNHLLSQFSDTHREAYLAGELDARVAIGRWKTSCRVATGKQLIEPGSGKSHLRATSVSAAKRDFGTLRNEGGGR